MPVRNRKLARDGEKPGNEHEGLGTKLQREGIMTPVEDSGEVHRVASTKEVQNEKSREERSWERVDIVMVPFVCLTQHQAVF